jgi:nucleotide-binding universal stress UspA family protein
MWPPIGAGHANRDLSGMETNGAGGPVVCGIGGVDVGRRVAAFARGLADTVAAPLIAVRAEAVLEPAASQAAVLRGHALLADALSEAERERSAVTGTVKLGDPATVLVAVAADTRAQLLVVGAGRSGAALGGVPREVARRASCPVVVLPRTRAASPQRASQRRHVLCAFDGSNDARATLGVAAAVAEQLGTAAFVAHMRPGCFDDLRAHAHAGRAAIIVAPSRAVEGWHSHPTPSGQDGWAPIRQIPLLLVPPTYGADAAPPFRAAAAV